MDGRTREAILLRRVRAELTRHVGGAPAATQRMLIDRLAVVALRLDLFDAKILAGALTDHDARVYGALHNAFRLMPRELGLRPAAETKPSAKEILAAIHNRAGTPA